ncbi:MAG: bifunctional phosphopantothenoylcysteine decarboxylase/phosphopantothenate--cysteine ligase CoaBC [Alphaproteobacteria bacterium]|jgi:phosphopantothenoylcysteine decarboxylase/phosphopantothenate--cysteine ligase|nr:bifunctional phosphopantothenoylcysteine decarboxylase/phosphopantothenate--cysteine ligase CoaBC [Alphaproteobacteria bacterium]
MSALEGKKVLVGVTGGIAAYKAPELVRRLRDAGSQVRVVMTAGAEAFITPLTLQAVSGHRVRQHLLDPEAEAGMGHIELARWADEILVAPATAHAIARFAAGLADDLLGTLLLATEARVWLAPAMNRVMWAAPSVRDNCALLESRGVRILGPGSGSQACGEQGQGRMLEPEELVAALAGGGPLAGRRFVVTAGPTHEPLDPVRFIGNRSSGRMGFALAAALAEAGAEVDLVAGPVHLSTPPGVRRHDVQTALAMREAVMGRIGGADGFVGVAAVADYRPAKAAGDKIKKSEASMAVELVPNPDILAEVAALDDRPGLVVGFAAETRDLENAARGKLRAKKLDLIAANRVGDGLGFDAEDNALEVFGADAHWTLSPKPKTALARELVAIISEGLLDEGKPSR